MNPSIRETGDPLSDLSLLERCLRGESRAREELAKACLARIRKTTYITMGSSQEMDDLVQTSMARVLKGLNDFRRESKLTTWVDKITVNTIREYYRRLPLSRIFSSLDQREDLPRFEGDGPDEALDNKTAFLAMKNHLLAIRPKKRIALILAAAYGYSVSEIAEMTGASLETTKKRLLHGKRELLSKMRKDPFLSRFYCEVHNNETE